MRPGFGPTLPALLRARFGARAPRAAALACGLLALGAAGAIAGAGGDDRVTLVHRDPDFTLLHDRAMRRVAPRPGELARLEARRGRVAVAVVVRALPADRRTLGSLPLLASRHVAALRARVPGFRLREEGKARVNQAPGYQIGFRSRTAASRTAGRDVLVLPDLDGRHPGVLLSLRTTTGPRRPGARGAALVLVARRAFRSFRFGTQRP